MDAKKEVSMSAIDTGAYLKEWQDRQSVAEAMIPLIGTLYRSYNVICSCFGRAMVNQSVIRLLKDHRFARHIMGRELDVSDTHKLLTTLIALKPGPAHLDVGKLVQKYHADGEGDMEAFLRRELAPVAGKHRENYLGGEYQDVVLYGFGRIGRLVTRILVEKSGAGSLLRLRAVVVRGGGPGDLEKRVSLLRRDSVHGTFQGTIVIDEERQGIVVNGNFIQFIFADKPEDVDYARYGIANAIVVDNTGVWRDQAGLSRHLGSPGARRVLLTAPGKGAIKNIVFGVNHETIEDGDAILSAASCTTNAIVPILKLVSERWGIVRGHVETVHSYTNDQNLIDNYHKAERRGRAAALNMVITETGAAKAAAKALPELAGKLTANAIRVPTANVSIAILNLQLEQETNAEELNEHIFRMSLYSPLQKQIDFIDSAEVASSDFVGNRHASVYDAKATIVDGRNVVLYVWYDNEFGYSCQVVRILQEMSDICFQVFPADR